MLKITTASVNDLVTMRLVNGSEVIGRLVDQDKETCYLERPYVTSLESEGEQIKVSLSPVSYISENTVYPFNKNAIMILPTKLVNEALEEKYLLVTSNISA